MIRIKKIALLSLVVVAFQSCAGTIPNSKSETFKVAGNCEMCEAVIEKAVYRKGISEGEWNADTKQLKLTYDEVGTTPDELLKKVAYAGYDNELYLAPDDAYDELPGCCHYVRMKKVAKEEQKQEESAGKDSVDVPQTNNYKLEAASKAYFSLKDALIAGNAAAASGSAQSLVNALKSADKSSFSDSELFAWSNNLTTLQKSAQAIADTKDTEKQRQQFMEVSQSFYQLVIVFGTENTLYLQHCPMYNDGNGADWLSKENNVKNPYYGSSMLTCGKTVKTLNKTP